MAMPEKKVATTKNGTVLVKCVCTHAFQEKQYNGRRLANRTKSGKARCTVCSKLHDA